MTTTERAAAYQSLADYRLIPGYRLVDQRPYLELNCPHGLDHIARYGRVCVGNLLVARQHRLAPVELVDLMKVALLHDDAEPSPERTHRYSQLDRYLGDMGAYTLYADIDEHPFLIMSCPYRGGRCPGSQEGECAANLIPAGQTAVDLGTALQLATAHEEARYGVPAERLAVFRRGLVNRKQEAICTRETADGASADIASVRADLISQLLAELDQAVHGG